MASAPIKRDYNLTDAELCQFTSNLVNDMTRDITDFGDYGVDSTDVTALETLGNAFEIYPSDEMYEGEVIIATDVKNNIRLNVITSIRNLSMRVEIKWGEQSGQYKRLGIKGMYNMSDIKLLYTARRVHSVLTEYLSDLADEGLTQLMLDDFDDLNESFETAMNTQHDKINARDIATDERIKKGNELYSFVVKYCEIGKRIWFNVDSAKYNDYVIYPVEHPGLSKPQNVAVEYVSGSPALNHISWDAVTNATNYNVYVSIREIGAPSGNFNLLDNFTDNFADVPPVDNKRNYYKIKAKNDEDTSDYSNEVFVDVTPA